jgi:hypothetical protein
MFEIYALVETNSAKFERTDGPENHYSPHSETDTMLLYSLCYKTYI